MADLSVDEFEEKVISFCSESPVVHSVVNNSFGADWCSLRTYLVDESFVDVFYNQKTGKTAFAQIRDGRRIFGADSRKGWHWHPREDPSRHEPSDHEITFEEFLREVEKSLK
jgi:hypothetical protein